MINENHNQVAESISATFRFLDWFDEVSNENWITHINYVGIGKVFSQKQFMDEMKRHPGIINSIDKRLSVAPLLDWRTPSNAFVINDLAEGNVCEKCGSMRIVLLLAKRKDYTADLDKRVLFPSIESYLIAGIKTNDPVLSRAFRIPVNQDDNWYCPCCNEIHRLKYHEKVGLMYDQEVLNF